MRRRPVVTGRTAFTLIEVMLAVTLSAFLIGLIAAAVHLNIRVLQRQQKEIERSQIARNVLISITGDLRAAIQYKPADVTGLDSLTVSQAAIAGLGGGSAGAGSAPTGGIDSGTGSSSAADPTAPTGGAAPSSGSSAAGADPSNSADSGNSSSANQNIANGQTEIARPGLYGNSSEIMIDISRLPRIDEYDPIVVGNDQSTFQLPTDVKTIAWFVSEQSQESSQMAIGKDTAASGGLYRRQLDRAVAAYSSDLASALASLGNTKLIAKEVIGIQFRYFDGSDWVEQWDSDEQGGFPAAVEVTILVDNNRVISEDAKYSMQDNAESGESYRIVINLPVAEILPDEESGGGGAP